MRQSQLFIAAIVRGHEVEPLRSILATMTLAPGQADPASIIIPFGRIDCIHVARLVLLEDPSLGDRAGITRLPLEEPSRLALITEGDGTPREILDAFVSEAGPGLATLFAHCERFDATNLGEWLWRHRIRPAASYVNWRGRTVAQVREESELHRVLRAERLAQAGLSPKLLAPVLQAAGRSVTLSEPEGASTAERLSSLLHFLLLPLLAAFFALPLLVALPVLVLMLRRRERSDPVIAPRPLAARNRMLASIEDHDVTNQYSAIGTLKPGGFRRGLTVAILWLIDWAARHVFTHGRLGRVNTIHFASWTFLDDKRRVFFASNYDGSREAYNDDFINKVAFGLNLSFSNGLGYPRTDWLIRGGARHEQDFKRYLFHHQIPTQVWYKAFPGLTTYDMARNARIRRGFEQELSGAALRRWIAEI